MEKLPVSFSDFVKDPVKAMLYLCIIAIVSLFTYLQVTAEKQKKEYREQVKNCETVNFVQNTQHEQLRKEVLEAKVELSGIKAQLETLKGLGIIK